MPHVAPAPLRSARPAGQYEWSFDHCTDVRLGLQRAVVGRRGDVARPLAAALRAPR